MSVIKITEENFEEEVMKADKPVIVDFYAEWCGPCKMMSPIIDGIAEDTDENLDLAQRFSIMSIPTIMIFKNGNIAKTFIGVTDKNEIINEVK